MTLILNRSTEQFIILSADRGVYLANGKEAIVDPPEDAPVWMKNYAETQKQKIRSVNEQIIMSGTGRSLIFYTVYEKLKQNIKPTDNIDIGADVFYQSVGELLEEEELADGQPTLDDLLDMGGKTILTIYGFTADGKPARYQAHFTKDGVEYEWYTTPPMSKGFSGGSLPPGLPENPKPEIWNIALSDDEIQNPTTTGTAIGFACLQAYIAFMTPEYCSTDCDFLALVKHQKEDGSFHVETVTDEFDMQPHLKDIDFTKEELYKILFDMPNVV